MSDDTRDPEVAVTHWSKRAVWLAAELADDAPLKVMLTEALAERDRLLTTISPAIEQRLASAEASVDRAKRDADEAITTLRAERDQLKDCLFQATTAAIDLSSRVHSLETERDQLRERVALLVRRLWDDRVDIEWLRANLDVPAGPLLPADLEDDTLEDAAGRRVQVALKRIDAALRGTP